MDLLLVGLCVILMESTAILAAEECTNGHYKVIMNELSICCPPCTHSKNSHVCLNEGIKSPECRCSQGHGCFSISCTTCSLLPTCERSQLKRSVKETTEYVYYCEYCPTGTVFEDASGICKPGKEQVTTTIKSNRDGDNSTVPSTKKPEDSSVSYWTSLVLYLILAVFIVLLISFIIHLLIWKMKASQLMKTGDPFNPHLFINRRPKEDTDTWSCQYPEEEHGEEHGNGPVEKHYV